jgi:hypothetical protein
MQSSTVRITEIDITRPARALMVLRWSDFILVVGCGLGAFGIALQAVGAAGAALWPDFFMMSAMTGALATAAYTGWRHVGVIDPRVWGSYLWVFPLLACVSVLCAFVLAATWIVQDVNPFETDMESVLAFITYLQFVAIAIPGFICVLLLRRMRIAPMDVRLPDLLGSLNDRGELPVLGAHIPRINMRRGLAYGLAGLAIVLAAQFAPVSIQGRQASNILRVLQQFTLAGFFLLIRARRYFQVSADSLLAVDKRPPILFLRSFTDDERERYTSSQQALLDFSLETRLANHFHRFGPFIAIGSPGETVPQPGAARVQLSDDKWQFRVLDWMKAARVIVMYCGITQWVNWELRQVIESGRATSLILMFPEIRGWRPWRRRREITARAEHIRQVFHDTPWAEELLAFSDFAGLRAMLFRGDGSMLMIRSRSRSRDAYHLAALVAHQQLIDPDINEVSVAARVTPRARRRKEATAAALTGAVVVLGALYFLGSGSEYGNRMPFERGELYYNEPVTPLEARSVGDYLVQQEFFNQQKATTAQLNNEQGIYQLRFVVNAEAIDTPLVNIQFGLIGSHIAQNVLSGKPFEATFCDQYLKPFKVVAPSARLEIGKSEIYYTHPITPDQVRGVADKLVEIGFFSAATAASVHLSREEGTYQLRFIVDPARARNDDAIDAFSELASVVARDVLGAEPLVVHLCDQEFRTLNSRRVEPPAAGRSKRS